MHMNPIRAMSNLGSRTARTHAYSFLTQELVGIISRLDRRFGEECHLRQSSVTLVIDHCAWDMRPYESNYSTFDRLTDMGSACSPDSSFERNIRLYRSSP
jgi:hypothetical protein